MMREPAFQQLPRPAPMPLVGRRVLILGLGDTGLSLARWVEREGGKVRLADSRSNPPRRADFSGELRTGPFSPALLDDVDVVCISPGVSLDEAIIRQAVTHDIPVLGDIELFSWYVREPVLAITGTNGKTTVTALTGHLLRSAGTDCEVAGNIAPPVLQAYQRRLLSGKAPKAWVLELSSYQLETTWSLRPAAAAIRRGLRIHGRSQSEDALHAPEPFRERRDRRRALQDGADTEDERRRVACDVERHPASRCRIHAQSSLTVSGVRTTSSSARHWRPATGRRPWTCGRSRRSGPSPSACRARPRPAMNATR
jgi:hypothetical protein